MGGGTRRRWRVREGKGGRGEREIYSKQRERDVETKSGDFPEVLDNRNCCFEEGQVLRVVLVVGGGQEGWVATTLGSGSYRWKTGVVRRSGRV